MHNQRLIVDSDDFIRSAVDWITHGVDEVLREKATCHLMLAGGGTPLPVYAALAKSHLPWGRLLLYFGDERCVPVDHPDSNYSAVVRALFPQGPPHGLRIWRMQGEGEPMAAAREYEAILPDRIDLLLLGIGEDGHTASLFPATAALDEVRHQILPVIGPKPPPQRLTITPPVIRAARKILVLAAGAGKADAVRRALEVGDVPAALARHGDWLIDRAAASALQQT